MGEISNFQIDKVIANIASFLGVFPSNYINKFIDHAAMTSSKGKYPFIIANTDNS